MSQKTKLQKDKFFNEMARRRIALTFDDVRLRTNYTEVMPRDVNVQSYFSRNIPLRMPLVSAAMDTVTEAEMAIAMATLGGLGIIHKNLTIDEQARQVARVKHNLNAIVSRPISVKTGMTINEIIRMREEKKYGFNTFPVIDESGRLAGLLTQNDFDFCDDLEAEAGSIMTRELITAPQGTTIKQAYELMLKHKKKVLPLVNSNNELVGMYLFSDVKRINDSSNALFNVDRNGQLIVGAAIGVGKEAIERLERLVEKEADVIVIDTAHADSENVYKTIRGILGSIKRNHEFDLVVGNVSEGYSAERLAKLGVDGIKVGQGGGSICTTRVVAGIGCPQVTAVYECSKAAGAYGVPVCSDGGIRNTGDIPIAIGSGASSVMMGGMLAGMKEAPGEIVFSDGRQWKRYRGMGSLNAMIANKGSRERYGQEEGSKDDMVPEGVEGLVPFKGELRSAIKQYVGGLRKGMGYVGAKTIQQMHERADFWHITNAGQKESHPHDIRMTEEPPNYTQRQ